ncbi:hypothetical protein Y032_0258g456 [Ancylostoma ceylanicum]|nr:hypothetical protein Y032_0258g456 [Ancylostoma ceylanicum]
MASLTELIICVSALVLFIYPAGTMPDVPKCKRNLGEVEEILFASMRPRLADLIIEGLPQQNHPQYTCDMEKLAHEVVLGDEDIANQYKVTRHNGPDNIVFWRVVKEYWKHQLENMGKVNEFGCDFAELKSPVNGRMKTTNYTIACVFN